ncbi:MAG: BrnT family toxin [Rhodomicrobium sp.]
MSNDDNIGSQNLSMNNIPTRFEFDWDPAKALSNLDKHGISFDEAMTVFLDPLSLSRLEPDSKATSARVF